MMLTTEPVVIVARTPDDLDNVSPWFGQRAYVLESGCFYGYRTVNGITKWWSRDEYDA